MSDVVADVKLGDAELLAGFEGASLAPGTFHHEEHVRVAWLYFQRYDPEKAVARFAAHIRKLVAAFGAEDKYHETITRAYLLLIRERFRPGETWEEFAGRSEDLLDPKGAVLHRFYSPELLASAGARERFVQPDLRGAFEVR